MVSIRLGPGRCLGVLGPNGSGKTTLTRLMAGLEPPDGGVLRILGETTCPRPGRLRCRCGAVFDVPAHWETLTGRQNLCFFARQYGLAGAGLLRRVEQLLDLADLAAQGDEPVSVYSFGMRRKLAVIEALVHDPDLLVLDEPSAGVDTAFLDRLADLIGLRCEQGRTTWIADNDADWLARAATDAVLLDQGRIAAAGTVRALLASLAARCRVEILLKQDDFNATPTIAGVMDFRCKSNRITADLSDSAALPAELLAWIAAAGGCVKSMEIRSITLYEALLHARRAKADEEIRP